MEFKIPETNLHYVMEKVEKLKKRAEKLNAPPIKFEIVKEIYEKVQEEDGERTIKFYVINVEGPAPKLNGWTFAATIVHEEGGNIFHVNPSLEASIPADFRNSPSTNCDHCHTKRIRRDTYVLLSEAGQWLQVGRSCLKDFLGHASPEKIAQYAEEIMNLDNIFAPYSEYRGMRLPNYLPLEHILTESAHFVRIEGYISRAKAEEFGRTPTASLVMDVTFHHHQLTNEEKEFFQRKYGEITEADKETAKKAIEWAKDLEVDTSNDYLWNIRTIANAEFVQDRNLGLACSMIIAYIRANTKNEKNGFLDEFYSSEGAKFEAAAKLIFMTSYETQWGTTHVFSFNVENKKVVWKTGSMAFNVEDIGKTFNIKGKIKKHEVYKEKKQTLVERVKVLS